MTNKTTLEVPLALQNLIKSNNALLKNYQTQLIQEIEEANLQMMGILQLNPAAGWVLDMENMVYTRQLQEEPVTHQVTDPDGHAVE